MANKQNAHAKNGAEQAITKKNTIDKKGANHSIFKRLAILGDSEFALMASFVLLLVAICVSLYIDGGEATISKTASSSSSSSQKEEQRQLEEQYQKLGPVPKIDPPRVYSIDDEDSLEAIYEAYRKDGVVAVRGLIDTELLNRLDEESRVLIEQEKERKQGPKRGKKRPHQKPRQSTQFHTMYQSAVFLDPPVMNEATNSTQSNDTTLPNVQNATAFLEVALLSQVPRFGSKLMSPELADGETVRMIRDIFLAKDEEEFICGWHVDDFGFWPATAASPGINAWIALDDMPAAGGGGFALAVGSHEASWRDEAHFVTGATTTFPPQGFTSAADMFENRTGSGTCNIQTAAPHIYRRMEETKRVYELLKGDVIFHQRWLFHRTVAFEREYVKERGEKNLLYRRYSVRFSPGSAIIPPGYGTELSVLWDENNGNRTADEVSRLDGPWYPQVWPSANTRELHDLKDLITNKIPAAQERKIARQKEMQPFLKEAASKQSRSKRR